MHIMDREFKYTIAEREYLEDRFEMGLLELINDQIVPRGDSGSLTGGGKIGPQVAFVWAGLRHYGSRVTEARVKEWMMDSPPILLVLDKAVTACLKAGILGFKWEPPPPEEPEKESPEGKADAGDAAGTD